MSAIPFDVVSRVERVVRERPDANALNVIGRAICPTGNSGRRRSRWPAACTKSDCSLAIPWRCVYRALVELVAGALGILAAGGCYVAMDPAHPDDRLAYMMAESERSIVVAQPDTATRLDASHAVAPMLPVGVAHRPFGPCDPSDPAYIVFTSGSTGRPKGVLIEHKSLGNLVDWHEKAFEVTQSDRSALISSRASTRRSGRCGPAWLRVPRWSTARLAKTDPVALRDWLVAERITTTFVPTPLCEELLALDWPASASLRVMLTGGDVLHRRPRADLPVPLVNNYGVSEAAVVSTSGIVAPADEAGESAELPTLRSASPEFR